jgi:hypothetical protein
MTGDGLGEEVQEFKKFRHFESVHANVNPQSLQSHVSHYDRKWTMPLVPVFKRVEQQLAGFPVRVSIEFEAAASPSASPDRG